MFYSWEQLRDISRPGSLMVSELMNIKDFEGVDTLLTEKALEFIDKKNPDFVFLYLGETDEFGGHKYGWMSDEYLSYINTAMDCVRKVVQSVGNEYTIIVTADHGGHDRTHGTEMNEDMQIPMFFRGKNFEENKELSDVSLLDIVPTVADVMGLDISDDWEGKSICNR